MPSPTIFVGRSRQASRDVASMNRLDTFLAVGLRDAPRDDVFGLEFPNPWDAAAARRAAELDAARDERPSIGRRALARGLAAVSRGSAAAARRHDDGVTDTRRASRAPAQ
jgi:hypothetical protein